MQLWTAKSVYCGFWKGATAVKQKSVGYPDELSHSGDDYSPPRKRFEGYNSDDDVSLRADDDLDCDS